MGTFKGCLPDVASRQCGDGYSCLKTSNDSNFICSITFDGKSGSYCDPQATQSSVYCASEYVLLLFLIIVLIIVVVCCRNQ